MTMATRLDQPPVLDQAERMALRAWVRGHATSGQQRLAAVVVLEKILGLTALPSSGYTEFQAGFAASKQWSGMVLAEAAGLRLWTPEPDEDEA